MDSLPRTIWKGIPIPVRIGVENGVDAAVVSALRDDGVNRTLVNQPLTVTDGLATGTLIVEQDKQVGVYDWQIVATKGTVKSIHSAGTFYLTASFDTLDANAPTTLSPNELRLQRVEKAIDDMIESGSIAYTNEGDSMTKLSLGQLRKERHYLRDLVNRERKSKGLPYLPGTLPRLMTQYSDF